MNNKNTIIVLIVLLLGVFAYVFFGSGNKANNIATEDPSLNSTKLSEVTEIKEEIVSKTIWNGLGFEPGFVVEIKSNNNNQYPTTILFQELGNVDGVLTLTQNDDNVIKFDGSLLTVNSNEAVPTKIEITKGKCVRPNDEKNDHKIKITFGDEVYNGCAKQM